jgi:hypothetical protein
MKKSETEALKTGERLEESECFSNMAEWQALQKEQAKRKKQLEEENGTITIEMSGYEYRFYLADIVHDVHLSKFNFV